MLAFLFQIKSVEDIIFVAFFSGLTFWQYKSYFKFAAPTFKIHWIRRGNSKLKGIALEFKEKVIKYGSGDDEILSSIIFIIPATVHALYNLAATDEKILFSTNFLWS